MQEYYRGLSNEDDTAMPCYLAPKTLCVLVN